MLEFFKKHYMIKHLLLFFIAIAAIFIILLCWMFDYTRHGEQILVPNVIGLTENDAASMVHGRELNYEIVDSIYQKGAKPGTIVDQDPKADSFVKKDRKIYMIINAKSPQMTEIPEVIDLSSRQAQAFLTGAGFKIKEIIYKPSDYRDLVLQVVYKNKEVKAGEKIPAYSEVTLFVGDGGISKEQTNTKETEDTPTDTPKDDNVLLEDDYSLEDELIF